MKHAVATILMFACTKSHPATTISENAATPLQIVVLDDYGSREVCDSAQPRKIEIAFDNKVAGVVVVGCRTKTVMPPPQVVGPTVTLPAGKHTVVARELGVGNSVSQQIELPVISSSPEDGTDVLATKLPIWASDDELQVMEPRVDVTFESENP